MKKSLIAIGLLTAFGSAQAASSVTLYGTLNLAYTKKGDSGVTLAPQSNHYSSMIGFKGQEDLGKGYSAIFNLQMGLNPDVGSGKYGTNKTTFGFNGESWVGLLTPVGTIRLGRATTPIVNAWLGGGFDPARGVGEFTGGLRIDQPEAGLFWNNGLFYDVQKNGFTAGFGVTTKGSESIIPQVHLQARRMTHPSIPKEKQAQNLRMARMPAMKAHQVCTVIKLAHPTKWTMAAPTPPAHSMPKTPPLKVKTHT